MIYLVKNKEKRIKRFLADQRSQQVIAKIKKLDLPAELKQQLINAKVYDIWFNSKDLAPLSNLLSDHEKSSMQRSELLIRAKM